MRFLEIALFFGIFFSLHVGPAPGTTSAFPSRAADEEPPCDKILLAYYPYWNSDYRADQIPYQKLTHICHAFVQPQADGSILAPVGPPPYLEPELITNAHAAGVKVLVSVGGYDSVADANFRTIASDAGLRQVFAANLETFCRLHGYDGADIDWEFPADATDRSNQNLLFHEVRETFNSASEPAPSWLLTMAISSGNWYGQWSDYTTLNDYVTFYNLMAYDGHGDWSGHMGHNAPLYRGGDPFDDVSVEAALDYNLVTRGIPPEKLILGLPFYGYQWPTVEVLYEECSSCNATQASYHGIVPLIGCGWTRVWDFSAEVPYLTADSGPGVISYDDEESIAAKVSYALEDRGLPGIFIWELSGDCLAGDQALLDQAHRSILIACGLTPTPPPTSTPSPSLTPTPSVGPTASVGPTPPITPTPSASPTSSILPMPSVTPTPSVTPPPSVTPTPSITPTPSVRPTGSITPTPSVTPASSLTPTPSVTPTPDYCTAPLLLADLEDMWLEQTRSSLADGWYYQVVKADPLSDVYGEIYDSADSFNDQSSYSVYPAVLRITRGSEEVDIQAGDYLDLTYDGSQTLSVYPPALTGDIDVYYYIGLDGSTYNDLELCDPAKLVPTPATTPTPEPTPGVTPTSTPIIAPTVAPTRTPAPTVPPTPAPTSTPAKTPTPPPTIPPPPAPTATPSVAPESTKTPTPPPSAAPPWIHDFDGDGTSDIGIYRGSSGLWAIRGVTRVYFGGGTDEPVPADYNGDGTTDVGIYRGTSGLWAIRGTTRVYYGSSIDLPEPGDYDGDGTADIGIFRDSSGLWAIRGITRVYFGSSVDIPAAGYYNGDIAKDIGIFRASSGLWAIRGISRIYFGSSLDEIVPGDYDGNGSWNYGIFRDSSGLWAIRGVTRSYFVSSIDEPVPADYNGNAMDDIGIFRDSSGLWAIRGISWVYFGSTGDIPVTR